MNNQQKATQQVSHFTNRLSVPELLTLTRRAHQWLLRNHVYNSYELSYMTADEKLAEIDFLFDGGLKAFYDHEGVGK